MSERSAKRVIASIWLAAAVLAGAAGPVAAQDAGTQTEPMRVNFCTDFPRSPNQVLRRCLTGTGARHSTATPSGDVVIAEDWELVVALTLNVDGAPVQQTEDTQQIRLSYLSTDEEPHGVLVSFTPDLSDGDLECTYVLPIWFVNGNLIPAAEEEGWECA
jgi:hypothetical protein